jgi:endogenous inhibitor of DNA gyrase (YacG/DUF329 family)
VKIYKLSQEKVICPKCKKPKAFYREMHADTDMNEIILYCPDCGEVDENQSVNCPFCGMADFDLVGLKSHLVHGDCENFDSIKNVIRIF